MASWGEIYSHDSDEVDHSGWGIRNVLSGHTDQAISGHAVRILRLKIDIYIQGDMNRWKGFGFQTVANGRLLNTHEVRDSINETKDIPYLP